jgi:CRISPR system Cascade subunit CasA
MSVPHMPETGFNLLDTAVIRTDCGAFSLPELLARLCRDEIGSFPALRHHQAPVWHAFLVQLAFHALDGAERDNLPADPEEWRAALRRLTGDWPEEEPWCLIAPRDRPAFLQPAVPAAAVDPLKSSVGTPDELDILVTSKNHDLKAARMVRAAPDDWLFALVSLQTQEGQMGRGNYGIARMNGGYGSRPFLGIAPQGGFGARFRRDLDILRRSADRLWQSEWADWGTRRDLRLLWLEPWDGTKQLIPDELHPLFIEICRRVRLDCDAHGRLFARSANSEAARIAARELKGITQDPWAPIETGSETKLLSLTGEGFSWRLMHRLLFSGAGSNTGSKADQVFKRPLLAEADATADKSPIEIVAAGLARGQGKTEGFHERHVPVPPKAQRALQDETARLARAAQEQAQYAGTMARSVLRPAILCAFERGPKRVNFDAREAGRAAKPFMDIFDAAVDATFFPALWDGLEAEPETAAHKWQETLRGAAEKVLAQALEAGPRTQERRFLAAERARGLFHGLIFKNFPALRPSRADREDDDDQ